MSVPGTAAAGVHIVVVVVADKALALVVLGSPLAAGLHALLEAAKHNKSLASAPVGVSTQANHKILRISRSAQSKNFNLTTQGPCRSCAQLADLLDKSSGLVRQEARTCHWKCASNFVPILASDAIAPAKEAAILRGEN